MTNRFLHCLRFVLIGSLCFIQHCAEDDDVRVVTTITIQTPFLEVALNETTTIQLTASAFDQHKKEIHGLVYTWSSSENAKATIDSTGKVTLLQDGTVTLTATYGDASGAVTIVIKKPAAPKASSVLLDDVANHGNASDFQVIFKKAVDESLVKEYRVLITKSQTPLQLSEANALGPDRYATIQKSNKDIKTILPSTLLDRDGDAITLGTTYKAHVLSVADGTVATVNSLSAPSIPIKSDRSTVKITFVGDDGVVITDGSKTVLIDALLTRFDIWKPAATNLIQDIQNGALPYDDVAASLITHDHFDHWDLSSTTSFMLNHPQAKVVVPPQVAGYLTDSNQITVLNPDVYQSADTTIDGIHIQALRMVHFDNFGYDFSGLENLAYVVNMGGKKILHLGDADFTSQNLTPFKLAAENIDVVILPAATIKITAENINLIKSKINPAYIIAAHLETNVTETQVKNIWGQEVTVFTESLQFVRY